MIQVVETKNRLVVNEGKQQLIISQPKVVLTAAAKQGAQGPPGADGPQGPAGPPGSGGDLNYTHVQIAASTLWSVTHNLGKFPSVTVIDSGNTEVIGDVSYLTNNSLEILFTVPFSGTAYLN